MQQDNVVSDHVDVNKEWKSKMMFYGALMSMSGVLLILQLVAQQWLEFIPGLSALTFLTWAFQLPILVVLTVTYVVMGASLIFFGFKIRKDPTNSRKFISRILSINIVYIVISIITSLVSARLDTLVYWVYTLCLILFVRHLLISSKSLN